MAGEITQTKRNELCLCVLQMVQRKYSLERYNSLIRPEIVELIKNSINDCSVERFLNERALLGIWRFRDYSIWFQGNEMFQRRNDDGRIGDGRWQLAGSVLNFSRNHPRIKVLYFDGNTLRFSSNSDQQNVLEAVRMSRSTFTWHDLVGTWTNRTSTLNLFKDGNFRQVYSNPTEILAGRWEVDRRGKRLLIYISRVDRNRVKEYLVEMDVLAFDGNQVHYRSGSGRQIFNRQME